MYDGKFKQMEFGEHIGAPLVTESFFGVISDMMQCGLDVMPCTVQYHKFISVRAWLSHFFPPF